MLGVHQLPSLPADEDVHQSALRYLIEGEEYEAAGVLDLCQLSLESSGHTGWDGPNMCAGVHAWLSGSRLVGEILQNSSNPISTAIERALRRTIPPPHYLDEVRVGPFLQPYDPEWQSEVRELIRGRGVNNQGSGAGIVWNNLRFRSRSEQQIAEALDRAGVFFLPNCRGRLGAVGERVNREPDFLVFHKGRVGLLEVDGEAFHPPETRAQESDRDRLFKRHGLRLVEHYSATRCRHDPDGVVGTFLHLLELSS